MSHTTHPSPAEAAIRPATFVDIGDLVAVYKASAPHDQFFSFVNQHVQQYPEDLIKYEKLVNHLWISPKYSDFHVMVAEARSLEDVTMTKVVACAVWDVSYRNKRQYGSKYKSQNAKADAIARLGGVSACRHVNPVRHAAMLEVAGEASKRLFGDVYGGDDRLELIRLKTHPDYMRRGFGSALVKWGINLAREQHLAAISVSAGQMGKILYARLGFTHLEQMVIRAPGDTEPLTLHCMVLELQDHKQPPENNQSWQNATCSRRLVWDT